MEDRKSQDNKMFERMWETVETEAGEIRIAKTKEKREERRKRRGKEERKEKEKEKQDNEYKKSSKRIGNLE